MRRFDRLMKMGEEAEQFPYLVVRLMAAVYYRYPIEFVHNGNANPDPEALTVFESDPFDADGKLTLESKRKLIEVVSFEARETGLRMCVVFGPMEAVYVEPEGAIREAARPPVGGVDIGPF